MDISKTDLQKKWPRIIADRNSLYIEAGNVCSANIARILNYSNSFSGTKLAYLNCPIIPNYISCPIGFMALKLWVCLLIGRLIFPWFELARVSFEYTWPYIWFIG